MWSYNNYHSGPWLQVDYEYTPNNNGEATDFDDELIDLEELLDDTFMPTAPWPHSLFPSVEFAN